MAWTGTIAQNDQMVLIGAEYYVPHNFEGIIDEVRICSRALNADEVYTHYLAGIDTIPPQKTPISRQISKIAGCRGLGLLKGGVNLAWTPYFHAS